MATLESNPEVIRDWMRAKQENEQRLAKRMYDEVFNGPALVNVRNVARAALAIMLEGPPAIAKKSMDTENQLRLYKRTCVRWTDGKSAIRMVGSLYEKADFFDASDCSDVVRLFGQWIEDGGMMAPGATGTSKDEWNQDLSASYAIKDAYRPGVQSGKGEWKDEVEAVWGDKKGRFGGVGVSRRDRGNGWAIEAHIAPLMRDAQSFSGMSGVKSQGKGSKRATAESNVLKLDRIFGLLVGADISGTTTDTVSVLENIANLGAAFLTTTYYLLPVATIVYNCHHTLIEVALALSLNKCIDYRIGFYSTLLPTDKFRANEFAAVEGILQAAESSVDNRHFLVWYKNQAVAGALLFNRPWEINVLKQQNLSKGTAMLAAAPLLQPYPTAQDIGKLVHQMAPQLEVVLKGPLSRTTSPVRLR